MAKIVVAEDDRHISRVIALWLERGGHKVLTAGDGKSALELLRREVPDLLITDYHMPRLSGLELCQRLKTQPSTAKIPAIMLTAESFLPSRTSPAMELSVLNRKCGSICRRKASSWEFESCSASRAASVS